MPKINSDKLIFHLKDKWKGQACIMCGDGDWEVNESVFQISEYTVIPLRTGGQIIPVVAVTCKNCGNTIFVNAIIAKAVEQGAGGKADE